MKKSIALMLMLMCPGFLLARGTPESEARDAIKAQYDSEYKAFQRQDVEGTLALDAPDFLNISTTGKKTNLLTARQNLRLFFPLVQSASGTVGIQSLTLEKEKKHATVIAVSHVEFQSTDPKTHLTTKHVIDEVCSDFWSKTRKGWLRNSSRSLSLKTK